MARNRSLRALGRILLPAILVGAVGACGEDPTAALASAPAASAPAASVPVEFEVTFPPVDAVFEQRAMGVAFQIAFGGEGAPGRVMLVQECFAEARRLERVLSAWSPKSELSLWNRTATAGAHPVSAELAAATAAALEFGALTGGAFDPTVAVILRRLGFYEQREVPALDAHELAELRARVGLDRVELLPGEGEAPARLARDTAGVELDLSGMAKGWAVDRVIELLRNAGVEHAFVVAGKSSMAAIGDAPGAAPGEGWPIDVPGPAGSIEVWRLRNEALGTSGRLAFEVQAGGLARSHVVDPATGRPTGARTELAVYRAPTATEADAVATALVAMGPEAARAWFDAREFGAERGSLLVVGEAGGARRLFRLGDVQAPLSRSPGGSAARR